MRLPADDFGPPGGGPGLPSARKRAAAQPPAINAPPVVLGLTAILLLGFAVLDYAPGDIQDRIIVFGGFWPARLTGAIFSQAPEEFWIGAIGLLTYPFLHGSWTHVIMNGLWLLAFGAPVGRRIGPVRFMALFFTASIAGALLFLAVHPEQSGPVIGASAGVAGLTGAVVRFAFRRYRAPSDVTGPLADLSDRNVIFFVLFWFAMNLVTGLLGVAQGAEFSAIAWEAHMGGFVAGLVLMPLFDPPARFDLPFRRLT